MKILVVFHNYLMAGDPGGSRFNEMARFWTERGHQVTVIAGTVNYSTGRGPAKYRGRWITQEQDGPIRVYRCFVPNTYKKGFLGRALAFLGFMVSASTAAFRIAEADVVIASSPPLPSAIPGWIAANVVRAPWIFEIRDLWPESAITTGVLARGSLMSRLLFRLEAWGYRHADRINVLTPAFRNDIVQRGLSVESKIVFVPNGADVRSFVPGPRDSAMRREMEWGDRIVALYAGAHGRANALIQLVDAATELQDRPDILIACVGDGPERVDLESEARRRNLKNIVFHGPQAKERMPALIQACDFGLAVLQNNPTFRTVYPNKVFDYMACSRASLLAIDGVARDLVCTQAKAGVFVEPENPKALAAEIRRLADAPDYRNEMGENGRRWVHANATREALADRYLGILAELGRRPKESRSAASKAAGSLLKAAFDFVGAWVLLLLLWPVLLVVALLIKATIGSPVLFRQERLGRWGKPFSVIKFRTMKEGTGSDEERLTGLGKFLRSSSLDELPELWNVVRGEMSLVGPRPLLSRYLNRYTPEQFRRHNVRPGITGWAQVNGRNELSWDDKFALDTWYVDHAWWGLDLKILFMTVFKVFSRRGISSPGMATMHEFMGSEKRDVSSP